MAHVDSLLRVLASHQGDELHLAPGKAPLLRKAGGKLKLLFPPVEAAMYQLLLGELVTPERQEAIRRGETSRFGHEVRGHGRFDVELSPGGARFWRPEREPEPPPATEEEAPVVATPSLALPSPRPGAADALRPEVAPHPAALHPSRRLVDLLQAAARLGASDLHLAHQEVPVVRVDGRLRPLNARPVHTDELAPGVLDEAALAELQRGSSLDTALSLPDGTRLRVHAYRAHQGICLAFRFLRRMPPSLAALGLPLDLGPLTHLAHGLILVVGPTGCGKTTTLAALAREALQARGGLLITLEDPIEYLFDAPEGALVRQRQVGRHVHSLSQGLRDALREDPDILLVGELRDAEAIALALTAAETGHLVLASLHGRTTASAIDRIVDATPAAAQAQVRTQLAESLRAVIAQRLLPARQGTGRVVALELLRINRAAAHHIREGRTAALASVLQTGAQDGMLPLARSLRDLVRLGRVDAADVAAELAALEEGERT